MLSPLSLSFRPPSHVVQRERERREGGGGGDLPVFLEGSTITHIISRGPEIEHFLQRKYTKRGFGLLTAVAISSSSSSSTVLSLSPLFFPLLFFEKLPI